MWRVIVSLVSVLVRALALAEEQTCPSTFIDALRSGKWDCAKQLADNSAKPVSGLDLRSMLEMETRVINKELSELKKHLESNLPMSTIHPAYQWAQSPDEIFLSIKFAHKLDTPGTLNVEAKNVTISEKRLDLLASDGRKNFVLGLDFLRDINADETTWSMASVGRMSFNIKKKQTKETHPHGSNWPRLLRDKKKAQNQHFWYEMHDKYSKLLDKIADEDEQQPQTTTPKSTATTSSSGSGAGSGSSGAGPTKAASSDNKKASPPTPFSTTASGKGGTTTEAGAGAGAADGANTSEQRGTPEYRDALKTIQQERKGDIAAVEAAGKSRKKMLDAKCKAEKEEVDNDTAARKAKLEEEYRQQIDDLRVKHGLLPADARASGTPAGTSAAIAAAS